MSLVCLVYFEASKYVKVKCCVLRISYCIIFEVFEVLNLIVFRVQFLFFSKDEKQLKQIELVKRLTVANELCLHQNPFCSSFIENVSLSCKLVLLYYFITYYLHGNFRYQRDCFRIENVLHTQKCFCLFDYFYEVFNHMLRAFYEKSYLQ